jgi:hypothetical protein
MLNSLIVLCHPKNKKFRKYYGRRNVSELYILQQSPDTRTFRIPSGLSGYMFGHPGVQNSLETEFRLLS